MVSLNATTYVAEITADTPFGTPVIYFSAVVDASAFTVPVIFLTVGRNGRVERVFKFSNGRNDEQYFTPPTPDPITNTITIVNQIVYSDDPRNAPEGQSPTTLPATLEMFITLVGFDSSAPMQGTVDRSVSAFVTVNPPPGEHSSMHGIVSILISTPNCLHTVAM